MVKWFIQKDFIGFPVDVVFGEYNEGGQRVKSDWHFLPTKINKNIKCFDTLEEMSKYKYCKCGKIDCTFNAKLQEIIKSKQYPTC